MPPRNRLLMIGLLCLAACAERGEEATAGSGAVPPLTAADTAAAVARGGEVATAVAQGLVQRLQAELASVGAAGAVDFCSRTALALTDSLVAQQPPGTAVRRTSVRIRNHRNAPDSLERAALAWFDRAITDNGAAPAYYLQAAGPHEVRFYRPLIVQQFCTQCHGRPDRLAPGVAEALAQRYAGDAATGYSEGDFRGVIRVSLPR